MANVIKTKVKLELTDNELYDLAWILKNHLKESIKHHYSNLPHPNPKQVFWEQERERFNLCVLFYELSGRGKGKAMELLKKEIDNTFKQEKED